MKGNHAKGSRNIKWGCIKIAHKPGWIDMKMIIVQMKVSGRLGHENVNGDMNSQESSCDEDGDEDKKRR